ncbi:PAS domain-containing sensor histidine kinase [Echinicola marina]|uniref:sensor histidine kinase n=1 Tax=Echinicola marina TaxID=2859768 RepID=UPI001CF6C2DA|nr:PAS domain-containing sensor histidine kinase [Echinicola marina]UCS92037.1 PAS domain-containing sensor histidine kinase [Echinicola marina]
MFKEKKRWYQHILVGLMLNLLILLAIVFFGKTEQPWYAFFFLMLLYPVWIPPKKRHFGIYALSSSAVIFIAYLWMYEENGLEAVALYPAFTWIILIFMVLYFHFNYKKKIQNIQQERKRLFAMFENVSEAILMVNEAGEIEMANKHCLKLFKYDEAALLGKPVEVLIPGKYSQSHIYARRKYLKSPKNRPMGEGLELFGLDKEGVAFPVEVSLGYFRENNRTKVIAFIIDITARKQAETQLQKINAVLESKVRERTADLEDALRVLEGNNEEFKKMEVELIKSLEKERELGELKSRFMTMASHEFRTPLSTILSSVFLLENFVKEGNPDDKGIHLQRIRRSVNNMTAILNDFFSLSKLDEGRIVPHLSDTNVREFVDGVLEDVENIKKKGQEIMVDYKDLESLLQVDQQSLRHIITNLLSNAIKFSDKNGKVELKVYCRDNYLELEVKDSGIGIPEEDMKHLFNRFFRAKNATNIEGTGLGLSIVKRYVEILKGRIQVESKLDEGTVFKVQVPLQHEQHDYT